jgi:hypothetical protein
VYASAAVAADEDLTPLSLNPDRKDVGRVFYLRPACIAVFKPALLGHGWCRMTQSNRKQQSDANHSHSGQPIGLECVPL